MERKEKGDLGVLAEVISKMVSKKSISQLQKEIKDIEQKRREEDQRTKLQEKLKRLKTPSKPKRITARGRIRMGLGKRVSGALDRASGLTFS